LMIWYFWFDLTQILILKKFEKEIVFESSVLAGIRTWIRNRILIEQKKILLLKRYKIALTTFWQKFWWITPVFLIWFDSNFDSKKNLRKKLSSKVLVKLGSGPGSGIGSGLSKNAGSGSVLNQSGSTTLVLVVNRHYRFILADFGIPAWLDIC
jgi:hypothetical protein